MRIDILTLFPEMFAPLDHSMIKRARQAGIIDIRLTYIRDFAFDKHATTDDRLYGGGAGMVLKPEPLTLAVEAVIADAAAAKKPRVLITAPSGKPYTQALARELAQEDQIIIICGHYEGIDQRVIDTLATDVVSMGDFVLTGGEIPALAIADSVSRLIPGVLGDERAAEEESFSDGLLEYPQYTRPPVFRGLEVPQVLQEGNHARIEEWRRQRSLEITLKNRPDLLREAPLSPKDAAYLGELQKARQKPFHISAALVHYPVYNKKKQTVPTSLANLDLHDISRVACTYALDEYFIVQPLPEQRKMIDSLLGFWRDGFGSRYNSDREQAMRLITPVDSIENVLSAMEEKYDSRPRVIVTSANLSENTVSCREMRKIMENDGGCYLLLFGTGWGLTAETLAAADFRLRPIYGREGYNHLSVRSAAAIIIDRLLGE